MRPCSARALRATAERASHTRQWSARRSGARQWVSSTEVRMKRSANAGLLFVLLAVFSGLATADEYSDTIALFKNAGESGAFFAKSYGYAVFPTVGKGGFIVGGAHGKGRVYRQGSPVGETSMTEVSVGAQAGGQAFSQIVFFEDKRAFDE